MSDSELDAVTALCAEFEITIIPGNRYPGPKETRAVAALKKIRRNHGEPHLRIVLSTLTEAGSNGALLDGASLWATSDLCLACADWIESDPSSWFEAWDALPIGEIMWLLRGTRGIGPAHPILFGALYVVLQNMRDGHGMDRLVRDAFDRKLFRIMKRPSTMSDRNRATAKLLGKTILAAQKHIAPEAFPAWLSEECGIKAKDAKQFVKLARETEPQQAAEAA